MLTTLYLKALDADFEHPILGDKFAKNALAQLDYDWEQIGITSTWAPLVTVRTAQFDIWVRQFLAHHHSATVVHLGCGLDSRVFRLDPGPQIDWYDVDFPEVIALREQVYPQRPNYRLVATSATDQTWLDEIPTDRPVLLVAEGISMYLTADDGLALLRNVVSRFPFGELQIDFYNWLAIRTQKSHKLNRRTGSTLYWAVNGPDDILDHVPGLRLLTAVPFFAASTFGGAPSTFRVADRATRALPPVRNALQYHRYAFGRPN